MKIISALRFLPVIFFLTIFSPTTFSQFHQWTWMDGDSTGNNITEYGTPGIPAPENSPGARAYTATWTDRSGNFWLYGGVRSVLAPGMYSASSDLWKYDVSSGLWTYIVTSGAAPGLKAEAAHWRDKSGNLWIFGSWGSYDLWKYTPTTNLWTFYNGGTGNVNSIYGTKGVAAPTNRPGTRGGSYSWIDESDNLWLFGGYGYAASGGQGILNDLWKYNIASGMWTWINGDSTLDSRADYGIQNVLAASNKPGARMRGVTWTDHAGNLWMFGGDGFSTLQIPGLYILNDLWKYDISSNQWVWIKGFPAVPNLPVYGPPGTFSPANEPGGKSGVISWVDQEDKFWLFGGSGYDSSLSSGDQNTLWVYDPAINQWALMNGDPLNWSQGMYGTLGVAAPANSPPARPFGGTWVDEQGNLWFYGGIRGYQNAAYPEHMLSDMWKYTLILPVPVKLISFTGKLQAEQVLLNWIVENESNLSRYEIERSRDAVHYEKAGAVTAKNLRQYNFTDDVSAFKNEVLYYRLKLIDIDSKFTYSRVINFRMKSAGFTLYPNPANTYTQLKPSRGLYGIVYIEIIDPAGKTIIKDNYELSGTAIKIPTDKLPAGTYRVTVIYQEERAVQSLVIVR